MKNLFLIIGLLLFISCDNSNIKLKKEFTIRGKVSYIECTGYKGTYSDCVKEKVYVQTKTQTYSFEINVNEFKFQIGDIIYLNIREYINNEKI